MPLGKSGKFHINPAHMRASGDAPEAGEEQHSDAMTGREGEHGKGDGKHHHHLTQHEDGTYTSEHTHPDGKKEMMEHPHFHHAAAHQAAKFEESAEPHEEDQADRGNEHDEDGRANYDDGEAALSSLYDQE